MLRLRFVAALLLIVLAARAVVAQEPGPGRIVTLAGTGKTGDIPAVPAPARETPVDQPFGVEWGPDGAWYVTTVGSHRVLRIDPATSLVTSVAGSGSRGYSGDDGPAVSALLNEPYEVRFNAAGDIYFVEMQNHLIRVVDRASGTIRTLAGSGQAGFRGDGGPARVAEFKQPHSLVVAPSGDVYVADIGNHRIRRIDAATGRIETIAGDGRAVLPQDGALAREQPIRGPRALALTGETLWVALREGNSVWRIELSSGVIRHVAGTGRTGYSGDDGPAATATFAGPKGLVADGRGRLYLVDTENQAIREVDVERGLIRTIAGGGPATRGFAVESGSAREARFDRPHGIGLSPSGQIAIGDTNNHRVRLLRAP
jgi:DNA-binding beta-propeller fold protein YncE